MYLLVEAYKTIIIPFLFIKYFQIYHASRTMPQEYPATPWKFTLSNEMFVRVRSLQFASNLQHFHNLRRVITSENSRLCLCLFVLPGLPGLQCRPRNQINETRVHGLCLRFNALIVYAFYMMTLETRFSKLMTFTNIGLTCIAIPQAK